MREQLTNLEAILRRQVDLHDRLLELLERKRAAIAAARGREIEIFCRSERDLLQEINDLEKARLAAAAEITRSLEPSRREPMRLAEIAQRIDGEESRDTLLAVAAAARERMQKVQRISAVLRQATETLAKHVAGVMQSVHSALSRAQIYERRGRVIAGEQVTATLDIQS